jgi:hypothetical protein
VHSENALAEQHRVWEEWAQADPLWAILSDPECKGGKWNRAEFFESGAIDIDKVLTELDA